MSVGSHEDVKLTESEPDRTRFRVLSEPLQAHLFLERED